MNIEQILKRLSEDNSDFRQASNHTQHSDHSQSRHELKKLKTIQSLASFSSPFDCQDSIGSPASAIYTLEGTKERQLDSKSTRRGQRTDSSLTSTLQNGSIVNQPSPSRKIGTPQRKSLEKHSLKPSCTPSFSKQHLKGPLMTTPETQNSIDGSMIKVQPSVEEECYNSYDNYEAQSQGFQLEPHYSIKKTQLDHSQLSHRPAIPAQKPITKNKNHQDGNNTNRGDNREYAHSRDNLSSNEQPNSSMIASFDPMIANHAHYSHQLAPPSSPSVLTDNLSTTLLTDQISQSHHRMNQEPIYNPYMAANPLLSALSHLQPNFQLTQSGVPMSLPTDVHLRIATLELSHQHLLHQNQQLLMLTKELTQRLTDLEKKQSYFNESKREWHNQKSQLEGVLKDILFQREREQRGDNELRERQNCDGFQSKLEGEKVYGFTRLSNNTGGVENKNIKKSFDRQQAGQNGGSHKLKVQTLLQKLQIRVERP